MMIRIDSKHLEIKDNATVADIFQKIDVNPETVLVKKKNKIITEDEPLRDGDSLELIKVISGG